MKLFVNNAVVFSIISDIDYNTNHRVAETAHNAEHFTANRHRHTMTTFTSRGHGELREPPLREAHHTLSTSLAPLLSWSQRGSERATTSWRSECEGEKKGRKNNIIRPRRDITNSSLKTSVRPQKTGRTQKSNFASWFRRFLSTDAPRTMPRDAMTQTSVSKLSQRPLECPTCQKKGPVKPL